MANASFAAILSDIINKKNETFNMKKVVALALLFISTVSFSQKDLKMWYHLDPETDSVNGISLAKTYQFLEGKKATPIIVAVIDSGIDTAHEDLKNVLWTNVKEIPGNGKDDDGNGYVDDVHGWNFLGNKNGQNVDKENGEKVRVYYKFKSRFEGKDIDTSKLSADENWDYYEWKKAAAEMKINPEEKMQIAMMEMILTSVKKNDAVLTDEMGKTSYTRADLESFAPETARGKQAKLGMVTLLKMLQMDEDKTNTELIQELADYIDGKNREIEAMEAKPRDYRAEIIKDNYYDINDRYYGNNDIMGPSSMHGTHVSGIIAADRTNDVGIKGIADHVKLMMIRAVPDGDEYDKDIALAIVYAVNNGAKVISMSFGKGFSPEKKWVDEAVKYAQSKDVLLVHAAGNEAQDIDTSDNFPNAWLMETGQTAPNFITVGASGDKHIFGGKIAADFSNFGGKTVDVFAPGVRIYSTLPGGDKYGNLDGTSMAAPVVSGIAALIRSYYPKLSAEQVKYAIVNSVQKPSDEDTVYQPGTDTKVELSDLSKSGGIVNAYGALKLASTLQPEQKKKSPENKKLEASLLNPIDTK